MPNVRDQVVASDIRDDDRFPVSRDESGTIVFRQVAGSTLKSLDTTTWKGAYADNTAYDAGDLVTSGGHVFVALQAVSNTNTTEPADGSTWAQLTLGEGQMDVVNASISGQTITLTRRNGQTIALAIPEDADELPAQTGHADQYLKTDGTDADWAPLPASALTAGHFYWAREQFPDPQTGYSDVSSPSHTGISNPRILSANLAAQQIGSDGIVTATLLSKTALSPVLGTDIIVGYPFVTKYTGDVEVSLSATDTFSTLLFVTWIETVHTNLPDGAPNIRSIRANIGSPIYFAANASRLHQVPLGQFDSVVQPSITLKGTIGMDIKLGVAVFGNSSTGIASAIAFAKALELLTSGTNYPTPGSGAYTGSQHSISFRLSSASGDFMQWVAKGEKGDTGSGLSSVSSDATLTGDGTSGDPLGVANPFTSDDETKLDGIAANAQVNVNADWNASSGDAQILNKPTIPTARGAGDGLTLDGNDLDVNVGDGIEIDSDKVRVKLNGSTLSRSSSGLSVADPFTDAYRSKLDGIENGAQVNPLHIARFSAIDSDVVPASTLDDGEIGIYNGVDQIQATDIAAATVLYIPKKAAAFGQDATNPATPLGSYAVSRIGNDLVANPGSDAIVAIHQRGRTEVVWFQASQITAYGSAGYELSNLQHLKGSFAAASGGVSWNVVVALTHGVAVSDIIDGTEQLVYKAELQGSETDRFGSYNNAFIQNAYRAGDIVLTSDTSGAPTQANQVRQPDIATGSGTICFGRLRTDADPNDLQWDIAPAASNYSSGDIFYLSLDGDTSAHLKVTLTSDGTLVGTGDGAYVYAQASWTETGNIADVVDYGDYFRIGREVPSRLQIEIPYTDILGAPWVLTDGSNVTDALKDAIQGDNEEVTLRGDFRVNATNVTHYVSFSEPGGGLPNTLRIRIPKTSDPTDANGIDKTDLERLLQNGAWVEIGGYLLDITSNATIATIGTSVTFTSNYAVLSGTKPTGNATRKVMVVGEDIHRGEVSRQAFKEETPSISGKGRAANKLNFWAGGSTDRDAGWSQPRIEIRNSATAVDTELVSEKAVRTAIAESHADTSDWPPQEYTGYTIDDSGIDAAKEIRKVGAEWQVNPGADFTDFREKIVPGTRVEIEKDAGNLETGTVYSSYVAGSSVHFTLTDDAQTGTISDGDSVKITLTGHLVSWDDVIEGVRASGTAADTKVPTEAAVRTALDSVDALPEQTGHGGQYLHTDGTDADWKDVSLLNFFDSGSLDDDTERSVQDTDSIQVPEINSTGLIATEDISGFGRVYRTSAAKSITFNFQFNATQGVAFRLRYSDTKPVASSDAKNYGTQVVQVNPGTSSEQTILDSPTDRYWFFTLSGGGSRTVNMRDMRVRIAYEASATGDITGVTAGDGLTGGGHSGAVSLAVGVGNGTEILNDKVVVKLDGTTITRSNSGIRVTNPFTDADETKLDGIATGAEVNVQSDWNASSGDAQILNKPTIPTVPAKASNADVDAETDDSDYMTVLKVFRAISRKVKDASATVKGIVEAATTAEMTAGTAGKYPDAAKVKAYVDANSGGGSGDITGVTAGDGLTGGGDSGAVTLAVDPGDGIEIASDKVKAKAHTGITIDSSGISVTNPFTDADETKLDGIATGAEVNVQSDWNASSGDAQILNKPTIPAATPDASTTQKGKIEIATQTEVDGGTDSSRAVTPDGVRRAMGVLAELNVSGTITVTQAQMGRMFVFEASNNGTMALPDNPDWGSRIWLYNKGSASVTVNPNGSDTIDGAASKTVVAGEFFMLLAEDSSTWITFDGNAPAAQVSNAEKAAGTETGIRSFSPKDVADMAAPTEEEVYDHAANIVVGGTGITVNDSDSANTITISRDALSATDIPNLNASKINAGQFATARLADNAVTKAKMADDSVGLAEIDYSGTAASGKILQVNSAGTGLEIGDKGLDDLALADLPKVSDDHLYVGEGDSNSVSAKPLTDESSNQTGTLAFDSGVQSGDDSVAANEPIDMGDVSDSSISRVAGAGSFVYRIDSGFTGNLRVRFDGTWNVGIAIQLRRSDTAPATADAGTLVLQASNTGSDFSGDANIASVNAQPGDYFWFALSSNSLARTISNRRLRLDGSWSRTITTPGLLTGNAAKTAFRSYIGAGTSSFSGAFNDLTGAPTLFTARGAYADLAAYSVGDVVSSGGHLYYCKVAVPNTNTTDPVDGATWELLSADATPDASTTVSGKVELATTAEMTAGTANKIPDAAEVKSYVDGEAFSGNYNDLTNKPTIPTARGAGNGLELSGNNLQADLDGSTLAVSSSGLKVADEGIGEAQLDAHNTPTDGQVLAYDSTNGLQWENQSGGATEPPTDRQMALTSKYTRLLPAT